MGTADTTPIPMTIEAAIAMLEGAHADSPAPLKRAVEVLSRAARRGHRDSSTSNQRALDIATAASSARESSQKILDILHIGNVEAGIAPKDGA